MSFSSSAGSAPTLSATAQQIETTSDGRDNSFTPFSISVSPDDAAQNAADAFTLSGSDCELTQCGVEISCTVDPHRVNGLAVASDVHTGHVVVSVTVGQYGSTKPTLVAKSGWSLSAPLSCTDPDSDTPSWTATLTKPLTKVVATAST